MSGLSRVARGFAALGGPRNALPVVFRLVLAITTLGLAALPPAPAAEAQRRDGALVGANVSVPAYPNPFEFGVNYSYPNGWSTQQLSTIAAQAGAKTALLALPMRAFTQFGQNYLIQNGDLPNYQSNNIRNLLGILTRPDPSCSDVPSDVPTTTWDNEITEFYPIKNSALYSNYWKNNDPAQGFDPNTQNCWAKYVYNTVSTYKNYIKVWQVWNEPDFTNQYDKTGQWYSRAPLPTELDHWYGGSIYSYIRAMRVTYDVVKAVDPTAFVAIGGIGYDSYLDAILRYTDNPVDGSITAQYPAKGGAWFDAVSWHHYPQYNTYDLVTQSDYTQMDSDSLAYSYALKQNNFRLILNAYGYNGLGYPKKIWVTTETGVASRAIFDPDAQAGSSRPNFTGGAVVMRNYILKLGVTAQINQNAQVHWYRLTDGVADNNTTCGGDGFCVFQHMGLFFDPSTLGQSPPTATLKDPAKAYKTWANFMFTQQYDAALSSNLVLPSNVRGYVFRASNGIKTFVLWARSTPSSFPCGASFDNCENGVANNVQIPSTVQLVKRDWDFGVSGTQQSLNPSGGVVTVSSVTSTPIFLTESSVTTTTPAVPADALGNLRLIAPVRVVDTRTDPTTGGPIGFNLDGTQIAGGAIPAGGTRKFLVAGKSFAGFTFPSQVSGVQINVTVVQPAASGGYVAAFPTDLPNPPNTSTVNPSTAVAHNFWTMRVPTVGTGAGGIAVYSTNAANVLVDVVGFWSPGNPATLGNLQFVPPFRVVDTRPSSGTIATTGFNPDGSAIAAGQLQAGVARRFRVAGQTFAGTTVPADVTGILAHVTLVQSAPSGGFLTLFPGDAATPNASTVNPSTAVAFNTWASGVAGSGSAQPGTIAVYSTNTADVVVDVVGYWAPSNPATLGSLSLSNPVRVVDTRPSGGGITTTGFNADGSGIAATQMTPGVPRLFRLNGQTFGSTVVPAGAKGVLLNVTTVQNAGSGGFLTVYPGNAATPNASTVNPVTAVAASFWASGVPTAGTNAGTIAAYSTNQLDLIVDLVGFFQ